MIIRASSLLPRANGSIKAGHCRSGPVLYGEGVDDAFLRLREEIDKYSANHSIFAWTAPPFENDKSRYYGDCGLLADSPRCFMATGHYTRAEARVPFNLANRELRIMLRMFERKMIRNKKPVYIASLDCAVNRDLCLGIYLQQDYTHGGGADPFRRVYPGRLCQVQENFRRDKRTVYIRQK